MTLKTGRFKGVRLLTASLTGALAAALAAFSASPGSAQELSIEQAWEAAVSQNTTASYAQFVLDFGDSEFAEEASCRVAAFDAGGTGSGAASGSLGASSDVDFCLTNPAAQALLNI